MSVYVLRRVLSIVALAIGISILVFLIIRLIPGDPALSLLGTNAGDPALVARLHQQLGLDESMPAQYLRWVGGVLHGDFGYSYGSQQSVGSLLAANFPATLELTVAGLALSLVFGGLIGIVAALRRNRAADTVAMGFALTCMSIPSFWLGLLLILLFAVQIPIFDVVGGTSLKGLVLPAVTLALGSIGFNARFVRSSVINAQQQNHVITAQAKGITGPQVFRRHVLRNALLPILTITGLQVGQLISGVVLVETVFSRPGIGRLLVQSILAKDYLTVQAVVLIIAVFYALTNFVVDLLYPVLDPRVANR
ncbi:MAG: Peptide/nickel transport system permease protein [Amycolatopsis sp.]|jgi:ABC-type dipeptide/oligopeptide/nickel transport system permease component|uniref:ABC transporter permease n=1 Tax=Amycolatopsis sp. TaxID=37632 RepID=UPI00261D0D64|nr:ABC transporter permease [Amycolatopsis sp.]MCU1680411.1 Peptide/nickel transport system permease protein [Amycolatopsis sp.]